MVQCRRSCSCRSTWLPICYALFVAYCLLGDYKHLFHLQLVLIFSHESILSSHASVVRRAESRPALWLIVQVRHADGTLKIYGVCYTHVSPMSLPRCGTAFVFTEFHRPLSGSSKSEPLKKTPKLESRFCSNAESLSLSNAVVFVVPPEVYSSIMD
jgi:hypothetical protein